LHKVDPQTFAFTGSLEVTYNNQPVTNLNELEFIHGEIWANVWQTEVIVRIDPLTGRVNSIVDLSGLAERTARNGAEAVLNGIAYDAEADRLLVTGKYWSTVFEIDLIDKSLREN
jgi:glutamine cyclotransferase